MIEHRFESENEDFAHIFLQNNHFMGNMITPKPFFRAFGATATGWTTSFQRNLGDLGHHLAAIDSAMILLVFTFTPFIGGYQLLTEKWPELYQL